MANSKEASAARELVRWWVDAEPEMQFVAGWGALLAFCALLWFAGAVVAMLLGWRPWL